MEQVQHDHAKLSSVEQQMQAGTELTYHVLTFVKSMVLQCATKLGVADAIHRAVGGSLEDDGLLAALSLNASKLPHLRRVMRVLVASGVFAQVEDGSYSLTPVSSLLVTGDGKASLVPITLLLLSPLSVMPLVKMAEWLKNDADEQTTAFAMAYGAEFWDVCGRDKELGKFFDDAMASDSRFVMDVAIRGPGRQVFDGITSLVDVAGGVGAAARAVAAAFPHIRCTVLDLPHVIDSIPADGGVVEFVAGDMMNFIPRANALLLKVVLHDWSDKDCVKILKRCKEAIPTREAGGKVIIIDMVIGSSSHAMCHGETQQLYDLVLSMVTPGMKRGEKEWSKMFMEAGFTTYKISHVLGLRSIIEVFP